MIIGRVLRGSEQWLSVHHHFHILPYSDSSCRSHQRTESFRACPGALSRIALKGLGAVEVPPQARPTSDQAKLFKFSGRADS